MTEGQGAKKMMVLYHFNWAGTKKELDELYQIWKKTMDKTEGAEFIGKYAPLNRAFQYTWIGKFKDLATWEKLAFAGPHDYVKIPQAIFDIFQPEP